MTKNTDKHQVDLTTEVVASFPNGGRVGFNITNNYRT